MNPRLKITSLLILVVMLAAVVVMAAENGENSFNQVFGWKVPDKGRTAWDLVVLPDLNGNGVDELLVCADNDGSDNSGNGADYYVLERDGNDQHKVLWHYFAADVVEEYSATYGDTDNDGNLEIITCMRPGTVGGPSLLFFEVDLTLPGYPLPAVPTCAYDLTGGVGWARAFSAKVADVDKDAKNELIVTIRPYSATGSAGTRACLILEDQSGDLTFPDFQEEFKFTGFNGSPWGLQVGDADNDGMTDIYVGEYDHAGLFVLENTAPDSYVVHHHFNFTPASDNSCYRGMGLYDFNGDGFAEIVYPCVESGELLVITNPGEIAQMDSSSAHVIAQLPQGINGACIGDQDWTGPGDDGYDIYCATDSSIYDVEYVGGAAGDVTNPANWVVNKLGDSPDAYMIAKGDFDRDGRREVVYTSIDETVPEIVTYLEHEPLPNFGVQAVWHDPAQKDNPLDQIKGNPRGQFVGCDVDQDGKKEIIATQYPGKLVMYEVTANNTLEIVWVDTTAKATCTGYSEPRSVVVGDFDGNGKQEIIACMGSTVAKHPDSTGVWFFEWNGKDNGFGGVNGGPTYILPLNQIMPDLTSCQSAEALWLDDIDKDGDQELLFPCDGSPNTNDRFIILSCVDGTLDSGFPVFKTESSSTRGAAADWNGSPVGAYAADLNGDGTKEAVFLPWDKGRIVFAQAVKPDSFLWRTVQVDPYETSTDDGVFYVSIGGYDVDKDGKTELMGALYNTSGRVLLINVPDGGIADLNPSNPDHVARIREATSGSPFNNAFGDLDGNGKPELFFNSYTRGMVSALAYNGTGNPMDPTSWIPSEGFYDNSFVYKPQRKNYTDTTVFKKELGWWNGGVLSQIHGSFGLKMSNDLDGDGRKELVISTIEAPFSDTWLYVLEATSTGVKENKWQIVTPDQYKLGLAYPNPFNATTTIEYVLPLDKQIKVRVYNMMGQVVRTLVDTQMPAGTHRITWDGMDNSGKSVATGLYLYTLEYGNFKQVRRMTLVK
jgi:hypothetical protein